jgi:hypothetical protein
MTVLAFILEIGSAVLRICRTLIKKFRHIIPIFIILSVTGCLTGCMDINSGGVTDVSLKQKEKTVFPDLTDTFWATDSDQMIDDLPLNFQVKKLKIEGNKRLLLSYISTTGKWNDNCFIFNTRLHPEMMFCGSDENRRVLSVDSPEATVFYFIDGSVYTRREYESFTESFIIMSDTEIMPDMTAVQPNHAANATHAHYIKIYKDRDTLIEDLWKYGLICEKVDVGELRYKTVDKIDIPILHFEYNDTAKTQYVNYEVESADDYYMQIKDGQKWYRINTGD